MTMAKIEYKGIKIECPLDGRELRIMNRLATRLDSAISKFTALSHSECMKYMSKPVKLTLQGDPVPPQRLGILFHQLEKHSDLMSSSLNQTWDCYWNAVCWTAFRHLAGFGILHNLVKYDPSFPSEHLPTAVEDALPRLLEATIALETAIANPDLYHWNSGGSYLMGNLDLENALGLGELVVNQEENVRTQLKLLVSTQAS